MAFWYSSLICLLIYILNNFLIAVHEFCTDFIIALVDSKLNVFIPSFLEPEVLVDILSNVLDWFLSLLKVFISLE